MSNSKPLSRSAIPILVILLGFFLLTQRAFDLGIQADEGVHISTAQAAAQGKIIYKEVFENRTPAAEWMLASLIRVGANSLITGRLLTIGATLISTAALITTGRLILQKQAPDLTKTAILAIGTTAGLLFLLTPLNLFWSRIFMLEPFVTMAASLSAVCFISGISHTHHQNSRFFWLFSGLWLGVAILFKQTAIVTTAAFAASLFFVLLLTRFNHLNRLVWWGSGLAIPLAGFVIILTSQEALFDFLHLASGADRITPFLDINDLTEKAAILVAWAKTQPLAPLTLIGVLLTLYQIGRSGMNPRSSLIPLPLIWLTAELTALFLPPELDLSWGGFSHYLLPTLAAGSLLAAVGIGLLAQLFIHNRTWSIGWAVVVLLTGLTLPSWWSDLTFVRIESSYPMASYTAEQRAGAALAAFVPADEPALVFGNAGFYYWGNRTPAAKFFHYPGYFATSDIGKEAEAELLPIINKYPNESHVKALLVSRHHLDFRLTEPLTSAIWTHWEPAAIFPYSYQQDVILFLPRQTDPFPPNPLALFDSTITLNRLKVEQPLENSLFVELDWETQESIGQPYTVFVHLLRADGTLAAQHDIQPGNGFRPTTGWRVGERITDYHWIELPPGENIADYTLSIGLYHSNNGERLLAGQQDSYQIKLNEVQK